MIQLFAFFIAGLGDGKVDAVGAPTASDAVSLGIAATLESHSREDGQFHGMSQTIFSWLLGKDCASFSSSFSYFFTPSLVCLNYYSTITT